MDKLFLLKPGFTDVNTNNKSQLYYCPECAFIEGVLAYYPSLKHHLEISYVDFPRPRKMLVDLLGDSHQGCPVLIVNSNANTENIPNIKESQGLRFLDTPNSIATYFALRFGVALPHH